MLFTTFFIDIDIGDKGPVLNKVFNMLSQVQRVHEFNNLNTSWSSILDRYLTEKNLYLLLDIYFNRDTIF